MCKQSALFSLLLLTLLCAVHAGSKRISYNYRNSGGYPPYGEQTPASAPADKSGETAKEILDKKSGFSTFGIIAIIFAVILFCLVFYYGIMCYPILCRDEKKYRFMDVSSTMTSATSRSIQSIENFPVDQKH